MEKGKKECNCKTPTNKVEESEVISSIIYESQKGIHPIRRVYILLLFLIFQIETTITSSLFFLFTGEFQNRIDPLLKSLLEIELNNGQEF